MERCEVNSSSLILCRSPKVDSDILGSKFTVEFLLDSLRFDFSSLSSQAFSYEPNPILQRLNQQDPLKAYRYNPGSFIQLEVRKAMTDRNVIWTEMAMKLMLHTSVNTFYLHWHHVRRAGYRSKFFDTGTNTDTFTSIGVPERYFFRYQFYNINSNNWRCERHAVSFMSFVSFMSAVSFESWERLNFMQMSSDATQPIWIPKAEKRRKRAERE